MGGRWKKKGQEYVLKTKWLSVLKKKYVTPTGAKIDDFYSLERANYVVVVAKTKDSKYILLSQYRHGVDKEILNFPMGFCEKNEKPMLTAKRELKEETGYIAKRMRKLGTFLIAPALLNTKFDIFLAEDCALQSNSSIDKNEASGIKVVSRSMLEKLLHSNSGFDSASSLGYLLSQQ